MTPTLSRSASGSRRSPSRPPGRGGFDYSNAIHGFSDSYYVDFAGALLGSWGTATVDLRSLTVGNDFLTGGNITGFKIAFSSDVGTVIDLDWIANGRFGVLSADLSNAMAGSVSEALLADGSVSAAKVMAAPSGPTPSPQVQSWPTDCSGCHRDRPPLRVRHHRREDCGGRAEDQQLR